MLTFSVLAKQQDNTNDSTNLKDDFLNNKTLAAALILQLLTDIVSNNPELVKIPAPVPYLELVTHNNQ